ncbi:hypothetical protein UFOVP3_65 [uncultured Caudovirales phage]|uniref:Uncharacterized protein n=1 Tax=uncultured Caudovirales phage TaxID=2100421 RepID=A0A6J5TAW5_9CAUD|nr:hypothetical protein UFOVP3_65 [uncultured Caudovirales phage]
MTTKFIVVDNSNWPEPTAVEFECEDRLKQYLTDHGIKYKKVYKVVQEMPFKFVCSTVQE